MVSQSPYQKKQTVLRHLKINLDSSASPVEHIATKVIQSERNPERSFGRVIKLDLNGPVKQRNSNHLKEQVVQVRQVTLNCRETSKSQTDLRKVVVN